jgi:hypothetical protein
VVYDLIMTFVYAHYCIELLDPRGKIYFVFFSAHILRQWSFHF